MKRLLFTSIALAIMSAGSTAHAIFVIDDLTTNPHSSDGGIGSPTETLANGITRTIAHTGTGLLNLVNGSPGGIAQFGVVGDTVSLTYDLTGYNGMDPNNPSFDTAGPPDLSTKSALRFDFGQSLPPAGPSEYAYTISVDGVATTTNLLNPSSPIILPATFNADVDNVTLTFELLAGSSEPSQLIFGNNLSAVPEPTTLSFLGLIGCMGLLRRKRPQTQEC